ncbi:hypothetical protein EVAR_45899_1 [Eumeta japonica]|uniref:Uncharacterized protein n=1 Tax=Eumeta variegata TaxID=151549 RepID=A0A4C1XR42_EUMVA|nr:hypothetical protein EVAR_45899_1 [Eumeta japonica]
MNGHDEQDLQRCTIVSPKIIGVDKLLTAIIISRLAFGAGDADNFTAGCMACRLPTTAYSLACASRAASTVLTIGLVEWS